jgi:hypothetical protein
VWPAAVHGTSPPPGRPVRRTVAARLLRLVEGVEESIVDAVDPRQRTGVMGAGPWAAWPPVDRSAGRLARHTDEIIRMGRMARMTRRQRDAGFDPTRLPTPVERLGACQPVPRSIGPAGEGAGEDLIDRRLRRHTVDRRLLGRKCGIRRPRVGTAGLRVAGGCRPRRVQGRKARSRNQYTSWSPQGGAGRSGRPKPRPWAPFS